MIGEHQKIEQLLQPNENKHTLTCNNKREPGTHMMAMKTLLHKSTDYFPNSREETSFPSVNLNFNNSYYYISLYYNISPQINY